MLRVDLRRSRYLATALFAVHAVALGALVPIQLEIALKLGLAAAICGSLVLVLLRHAFLLTPDAIVSLELAGGDTCTFRQRSGLTKKAEILGTTYVTPGLTVLNLKVNGRLRRRHALVVSDNVDPEIFRQLRVMLRWARGRDKPTPAV